MTANSGGGVEDDGLNFCITNCGISLRFGSCRFNRYFATVILFQMTSPITTTISTASRNSGTSTAAAMAPGLLAMAKHYDYYTLHLIIKFTFRIIVAFTRVKFIAPNS